MKVILRSVLTARSTAIFVVLAVIGLAYLFGYLTAEHRFFPQRYLAKLESIVVSVIRPDKWEPQATKSIATIFVKLNVDEIEVPGDYRAGGALTSFGDELLLITGDGDMFLASQDKIERTQIEPPANGLGEYIAAAESEKYKDLQHNFSWFRYNDILYYSEDGQRGLVVSYTEWIAAEECYGTSIARLVLPTGINSIREIKAIAEDWRVVYRTQPCLKLKSTRRAIEGHMAGGRIAYLQPHKIVLGSGDYHWDGVYAPDAYAQESGNDYGKVLEIDLNKGTSREVSIGHRNMQGVLVDSNGQIWVAEHGPRGGDELNRIIEGGNFGWPKEVLGTDYDGLPWPGSEEGYGRHDKYVAPVYAWVPSIAVSSLTEIHGFHPSWDGDILVSTLIEKSLFRMRIKKDRVLFAEPIKIGERIRYAHQHTDGRIVLWTDSRKLLFVSLGAETYSLERIHTVINNADYDNHEKERIKSAIDGCAQCHSFEANDHERAPGLGAIFDSRIASTSYTEYSGALRSRSGRWTGDQLTLYFQDPQTYAPGTSMPNPGIEDQFVIDGIVDTLKRIKHEPN